MSSPDARRNRCAARLLALLAATSIASTASAEDAAPPADPGAWHEGDPVPTGYHHAPRARRDLAWTGASIFFLSYAASALAASTSYLSDSSSDTTRGALWVPVAGPFVQLPSESAAGVDALLVLDGLAQLAGLSLFVYGETRLVEALVPDEATKGARLVIAPLTLRGGSGVGLVGTF